jgi:hypothetical protein
LMKSRLVSPLLVAFSSMIPPFSILDKVLMG